MGTGTIGTGAAAVGAGAADHRRGARAAEGACPDGRARPISLHPTGSRHTNAHDFLLAGGQERDLKRLMGWRSDSMLQPTATAPRTTGPARPPEGCAGGTGYDGLDWWVWKDSVQDVLVRCRRCHLPVALYFADLRGEGYWQRRDEAACIWTPARAAAGGRAGPAGEAGTVHRAAVGGWTRPRDRGPLAPATLVSPC